MSVGEWLNAVIRPDDGDYGEPMRFADYDDEDDGWRDDSRQVYRDEYRRRPKHGHGEPRRHRDHDREAALAREQIGAVHARLDRLAHQLERIARSDAARLTGAPTRERGRAPPLSRSRNGTRSAHEPMSIDDAIVEIAERQRTLYSEPAPAAPSAPTPEAPAAPAPAPSAAAAATVSQPPVDISNIEDQLRRLTARIESLRPNGDPEKIIQAVRHDLADIRRQFTEAQPRNAVTSLEDQVDSLAERIDHSRQCGVDAAALAGLEAGLADIREALRGLTPAENLVGFDDTVKSLAQKVDRIIVREDPAALQQLETAIIGLRGIVSHVASNDTLNKVADDVRALAAKIDALANSTASGKAVSALESRIDTLAGALSASAEAGQAVPRDLEKLLAGLIEKLEWVQLTHTDHAALGALEDRIAQLIKRLDASDARLGNLEAVERGLADLLVHIDQIRGGNGATAAGAAAKAGAVDAIVRDVAEIKRSELRTRDSLEAVHGAVEHVVDRLAMIESVVHDDAAKPEPSAKVESPEGPAEPDEAVPAPTAPAAAAPAPTDAEAAVHRAGTPRPPIDPNLPPNHPLEPGSAGGVRMMPSAADRIAASEAAIGLAKPPAITEPGDKPNFIAAARRAAQAAAAAPPERSVRAQSAASRAPKADNKPSRLRKLIVAGAAVLIAVGGLHIALHMFPARPLQNGGSDGPAPAQSQQAAPPAAAPQPDSSKHSSQAGPLVVPVQGAASGSAPAATPDTSRPGSAPEPAPNANMPAPPPNPARQSALHDDPTDITGSLSQQVQPPAAELPDTIGPAQAPQALAPAAIVEKLPATIGGPVLRAAAMAGDAAAEFEVASRFAEGHGVPPSDDAAARWLERAAKQGLAPAQFRLGGFYEKGVGVKKDLHMARDLYAAAAAKGNGKAMHNLAVLYAEGVNGAADYQTAAHWFRKAAERGITDSQYNLAILCARGVGVEQNYAEAYKWFALAASAGDGDAGKKRDDVASRLDAQALAAAKAAVQKWSAIAQPDDAVNVKVPPAGWDMPEHAVKPKPRSAGGKTASGESKLD